MLVEGVLVAAEPRFLEYSRNAVITCRAGKPGEPEDEETRGVPKSGRKF